MQHEVVDPQPFYPLSFKQNADEFLCENFAMSSDDVDHCNVEQIYVDHFMTF